MTIIVFVGTQVLPGDVAQAVLGQNATEAALKQFREELSLNQSPIERYLHWIGNVAVGDLGKSWTGSGDHRPEVSALIWERLLNTATLTTLTALVSVPLSIALGLVSALYGGGLVDRFINAVTLLGVSLPEFFTGALLVSIFTVKLNILPGIAIGAFDTSISTALLSLVLPILTLTFGMLAHMTRMTRSSVLAALQMPYAEMARLNGIGRWRIVYLHALPNAWPPIISVISLNLAYLVGSVVVVETIFAFPGLGKLMVDAVTFRDVPVVQACALVFCGTYVVLNLVADILSMISNPKIMYPK